MLSKEYFLKSFSEDDVNEAVKIYENYKLAYEKDITIFSNSFCSPNIWSFFEKNCQINDFKIVTNGIFEEAERRMIAFNNNYDISYPIEILEIKNKSNFSALKHKDYLGAILSLGIERNKIGDIVVKEEKAYVPIVEDISSYIINNLSSIGRSPVEINLLNNIEDLPSIDFEEILVNVQSLRLDSVVAKLANVSRSKAIELLDSSKVLVNYIKSKDKSQELLKGTRLTIRGYGKYIVGDTIGKTRSGKQRIVIKKYI
ncbi:YlmH/Sll1252 family protein [Clostridium sp. AL.422]|uniref:YlmH/Sll1252 family protein n=1 Tax=Clostridium TaxID=1485 RepID=UPI00293DA68F|nr:MULTISPECIES: YlmH/Sll1252 family protein [unclassified Clostridium]MDV4152528.1 YlmH/Sll1252 family protein [Clostridium sp. AL.422]